MTYCDRILAHAPSIPKQEALDRLEPWRQRIQASELSLSDAVHEHPPSPSDWRCIQALHAEHVRQIDDIVRRLHEREVEMSDRSVHTPADLHSEALLLFQIAIASYTEGVALSTHVHIVMTTRLQNVVRDSRKRDDSLDAATFEDELEPPAPSTTTPLPTSLDIDEIAERLIEEHAKAADRPAKERQRARQLWQRLRDPA